MQFFSVLEAAFQHRLKETYAALQKLAGQPRALLLYCSLLLSQITNFDTFCKEPLLSHPFLVWNSALKKLSGAREEGTKLCHHRRKPQNLTPPHHLI